MFVQFLYLNCSIYLRRLKSKFIMKITLLLIVTFCLNFTLAFSQRTFESELSILNADAIIVDDESTTDEEVIYYVERVKKGTNMLLPSICHELSIAQDSEERFRILGQLLEAVQSADNSASEILAGAKGKNIRKNISVNLRTAEVLNDVIKQLASDKIFPKATGQVEDF